MTQDCPACGSDRLHAEQLVRRYAPPFGAEIQYEVPMITCQSCDEGFEADGAGEIAKRAICEANRSSARKIVEQLEGQRVTMAYMERALGLAPRTVARWKSGEVSASGLALLRIVRTFPWILKVAGARFDPSTARAVLSAEAFSTSTSVSTVSVVEVARKRGAPQSKAQICSFADAA